MYRGTTTYCSCPRFVPDWDSNICALCKFKKPPPKTLLPSTSTSTPSTPSYYPPQTTSTPSQTPLRNSHSSWSSSNNTSSYSSSTMNNTHSTPYHYPPTTVSQPLQNTSRSTITPKSSHTSTASTSTKRTRKSRKGESSSFLSSILNKFKTSAPPTQTNPVTTQVVDNRAEVEALIDELNAILKAMGKKPLTLEEKMQLRLGLKDYMQNPEYIRSCLSSLVATYSAQKPSIGYNNSSPSSSSFSSSNPSRYSSSSSSRYSSSESLFDDAVASTFTSKMSYVPTSSSKKKSSSFYDDLTFDPTLDPFSSPSSSYDDPTSPSSSSSYSTSHYVNNDSSYSSSPSSSSTYNDNSTYNSSKNSNDNDYNDRKYGGDVSTVDKENDVNYLRQKVRSLKEKLQTERRIKKDLEVEIFHLNYANKFSSPSSSSSSADWGNSSSSSSSYTFNHNRLTVIGASPSATSENDEKQKMQQLIEELKIRLNEKSSSQIEHLKSQFVNAGGDIAADDAKFLEMKLLLQQKDDEIAEIAKSLSTMKQTNQQLQAELSNSKVVITRLEEGNVHANVVKQLQEKLSQEKLFFDQQIQTLQSTLSSEITLKNQSILENAKLKEEVNSLLKKLETLQSRKQINEKITPSSSSDISFQNHSSSSPSPLPIRNENVEIASLRDEMKKKEIEINQLHLKISELEMQQIELSEITTKNELKSQLTEENHQRTLKHLQSTIDQLTAEKNKLISANVSLESSVEVLTTLNTQFKERISLQSLNSKSSSRNSSQKKSSPLSSSSSPSSSPMQQKSNNIINNNSSNNNAAIAAHVTNDQKEIQILREKLTKSDRETLRLNMQIKDITVQKTYFEEENAKLVADFEKLRGLVASITNEREKLNQRIQQRNSQLNDLSEHYTQHLQSLQNQLLSEIAMKDQLSLTVNSLESKVNLLQNELNTLAASSNSSGDRTIPSVHSLIPQSDDRVDRTNHGNDDEDDSDHVDYQQLIVEKDNLIEALERENNILQKQMQHLQSQLNDTQTHSLLHQTELQNQLHVLQAKIEFYSKHFEHASLRPAPKPLSSSSDHHPHPPPPHHHHTPPTFAPPTPPLTSDHHNETTPHASHDDHLPSLPPPPPPPPPPPEINQPTNSILPLLKSRREAPKDIPSDISSPPDSRSQLLDQIRSGVLLKSPSVSNASESSANGGSPSANEPFDPNNILHVLLKAMISRRENIEDDNGGDDGDDDYDDEEYDEEFED